MALTTLPYPSLDFVPLDILTAEEMNQIVANYTAINNATIGTSQLADSSITTPKLANKAVTSDKVDWTTIGKSSSRCIKLGDVKIMWGKTTVVMNGTAANSFGASTVTLPESFGNNGYSAVASPQDPAVSNAIKCTIQNVNNANFQITVGTAAAVNTANVPVRWIAIG